MAFFGIVVSGVILFFEHRIVRRDFSKIDRGVFHAKWLLGNFIFHLCLDKCIMSEVRLFKAPLSMVYECDRSGDEKFLREFNSILPGDEDALGAWLKRAKSRGETKESDQVLLTLVIELHRKIDALSDYIKK